MKPYPNEELDRMSKREIIRLYKRTVEQFNDTVPVRYGKWMSLERSEGKVFCSNCKKAFDWDAEAQYYNYCPNCGARMDEEE